VKYSEELILHFTCDKCNLWWSIAISNKKWVPMQATWFCPWCGHKHKEPYEKISE
jgi:transcription elongation factor Elf1